MDTAEGLKKAGNNLWKQGKYKEALAEYQKALSLPQQLDDLTILLLLNCAACFLSLSDNEQCIEYCSRILQRAPKNAKAFFRRAKAYENLGKLDQAISGITMP
jgi:tetratricopeptide (TPR) repeat protein